MDIHISQPRTLRRCVVVRIPSSAPRSEGAGPQDDNGDGRIDEREAAAAGAKPMTADSSAHRSASAYDANSPTPHAGSYETTADNAASADRARGEHAT
ncbi:MAG TPA: hypothetical protein VF462_08840, partial [Micromonosporaceae bacterium]